MKSSAIDLHFGQDQEKMSDAEQYAMFANFANLMPDFTVMDSEPLTRCEEWVHTRIGVANKTKPQR